MNRQLSEDQIEQLWGELRDGGKIAAIKLYKNWTGASLLEAKLWVERLVSNGATATTADVVDVSIDENVMDQILDAIQLGNKLQAVKLYRESSGASLFESKQFIERLMSELGMEEPRRTGCAGIVLALLVGVCTLVSLAGA